ncbi:nuclear transport factor 2 family protein [Ruegeria jejuensis]|uniref:nuclear transport factor 2 family protein n=1 Tax=Ruegeria jejuensis TaxID=3233338 RepID=UPI00355B4162
MTETPPRAPLPPFSYDEAIQKVRMAENAWNTRDPVKVAQAYTIDTRWRNRSEFPMGRAEVQDFLTRKWAKETGYRLIKEIWAHDRNRIAVRFCYEWHNDHGQWFRAHGNENWEFDDLGYMAVRHASINDVPITDEDRLFHWPEGTARPDHHPGLTELGL